MTANDAYDLFARLTAQLAQNRISLDQAAEKVAVADLDVRGKLATATAHQLQETIAHATRCLMNAVQEIDATGLAHPIEAAFNPWANVTADTPERDARLRAIQCEEFVACLDAQRHRERAARASHLARILDTNTH